ncbi:hypothetical protein [Domibacillus sp. PGB-M46]|uniref:hypothetical protein n=1 Tax=Domibacillus sp. PGB-M46 TaxID=2910255 RepID=UPI0028162F98|nr:hypothetical protein [Domibacillus sp. PGB-M46]
MGEAKQKFDMPPRAERNKSAPFGMKDKLGYLFGDFGSDFFFMLVSTFLMVSTQTFLILVPQQ